MDLNFYILRDMGVPYGMPLSEEQMTEYYDRLSRRGRVLAHHSNTPLRQGVPDYRRSPQSSVLREAVREPAHESDNHQRTRHAKPAHLHQYHTGESHAVTTRRHDRADRSAGTRRPRHEPSEYRISRGPGQIIYDQVYDEDLGRMINVRAPR